MKMKRSVIVFAAMLAVAFTALAASFPSQTGDIASNGEDGWNGAKPGSSEVATFGKNSGSYTASDDVAFGAFNVNGNYGIHFNLDTSGNHTVKLGAFAISADSRTATLHGGVWDISGSATGSANIDLGSFGPCNKYNTAHTALVLTNSCLVTNVTRTIVSNGGAGNTFRISDSSKVYTAGALLFSNAGATDCLLEITSGGALTVLTGNLLDSNDSGAPDGRNRIVVSGAGSKIVCPSSVTGNNKVGFSIGYAGGHNSLLVEDGGEVVAPYQFHIGRNAVSHTNSAVFKTDARFTLGAVNVGEFNSCGNSLEFLSGASGTMSGALRIGGYSYPSSGNKMTVSNAIVSASSIIVGYSAADDTSAMFDNGLAVQGDSARVAINGRFRIWSRSFLTISPPRNGYQGGAVPITAADFYIDNSSRIEVEWPDDGVKPGEYTVVSTTSGIFLESSSILEAANASLAAQSKGRAKLLLANGNKDIVLKIAKGLVISFR